MDSTMPEGLIYDYKKSIYYNKDYANLYLDSSSELFEFYFEEKGCYFYNLAIKRDIENTGFYDLETPYGYGGYITNCDNKEFVEKAFRKYKEHCYNQNIIAEFIRFYPFNIFPSKYGFLLDFVSINRQTVIVDLTLSKQERWKNYSSTTRNEIRKSEKYLNFNVDKSKIENFIRLYYNTMDKNRADKFYYFSESYFYKIIRNENVNLFCITNKNDSIISMSIFLEDDKVASYHLSAKDYEVRGEGVVGANYFLLDQIFDYYKSKGKKIAFLGGGRSGSSDDDLLKFKMKFSKSFLPFYIGGVIFNRERYDYLCEKYKKSPEKFLAYR